MTAPLLFTISLLANAALVTAAEAELKIRCKKTIHGAFHVDEFDGWKIVTNDMVSELDGVSITQKSQKLPAAALPNDFRTKGVKAGTLKVTGKDNWLVCHHSKMLMVIERKLPDGIKSCTLTEQPDAIAVDCR